MGVAAGDRVAMLGGNSDRYFDCFFAASRLGALTVPLNTRLARNELAACLRDSGAEVLLADGIGPDTTTGLAGDLPGLRHVIHIGDGAVPKCPLALDEVRDDDGCDRAGGGGELAAGIFYTGGTTGAPKGVVLTHDNLLANAWHTLPSLGWSGDTVFLHAAPMFHAAGICCLVAVSVAAGRQVILPRFDAEDAIRAVEEHGVTARGLAPTMINALAGRPLPARSVGAATT